MTDTEHSSAVVATVTGKDLLDRLDSLSANLTTLAARLDDIPTAVHDHETRLRALEATKIVTWPQAVVLCTLLLTALGVIAAFLAVR